MFETGAAGDAGEENLNLVAEISFLKKQIQTQLPERERERGTKHTELVN